LTHQPQALKNQAFIRVNNVYYFPREVIDTKFNYAKNLLPNPFLPSLWDNYKQILQQFDFSEENFFLQAIPQLSILASNNLPHFTTIALHLLNSIPSQWNIPLRATHPNIEQLLRKYKCTPAMQLSGIYSIQPYPD
jgi:hypothetical protein